MNSLSAAPLQLPTVPHTSADPRGWVTAISGSALFCGLTQEECHTLALSASVQALSPGEPLFLQGQQIRDVLLVASGAVKLSQRTPQGEKIILRMSTRGDTPVFPLEGPKSRYSCTAHALGRCTVLRWDLRSLQWAMATFPAIRRNVDELVSQRLRELEERCWELMTVSAVCRLARTIVRLSNSIGREQPEGIFIPITRDELARMAGMTMFTVSRFISAWISTGWIQPGRREALVVCNPGELLALCGESCGEV